MKWRPIWDAASLMNIIGIYIVTQMKFKDQIIIATPQNEKEIFIGISTTPQKKRKQIFISISSHYVTVHGHRN